jgi:hypothetical protein
MEWRTLPVNKPRQSDICVRISGSEYWQLGYCDDTCDAHRYSNLYQEFKYVSGWHIAMVGKLKLDKWPGGKDAA